jgi:hypothetical protein
VQFSHEAEKGNKRSLFNGLGHVILQSKAAGTGILTLTTTSPDLKPVTVPIDILAVQAIPSVATKPPHLVLDKCQQTPIAGDITIAIPAADSKRELSVLIETDNGKPAGLGGLVTID